MLDHSCRELTKQDYELHIAPLLAKYPDRLNAALLKQISFNAAASWVASRAFGIDSYHGESAEINLASAIHLCNCG